MTIIIHTRAAHIPSPSPLQLDWTIDPRLDDDAQRRWEQHVIDCNWLRLWPDELHGIEARLA